ncbi:lactate permease, partial [Veillonellaceae bacterium M2-4]|nr:lactate permease [Veillonellaceae bacterium M2-4]
TLAIFVSLQLLILCILVPFLLVLLVDSSFKELKKIWYYPLTAGLVYDLVQLVVSYYLGAELPTIMASLVTLIALIILARVKSKSAVDQEKHTFTEIVVAG